MSAATRHSEGAGERLACQWFAKQYRRLKATQLPEAVIKRAAAHCHEHHCGPESIIPEIEAAIRRGMVEV